jgi:hypothetical protein
MVAALSHGTWSVLSAMAAESGSIQGSVDSKGSLKAAIAIDRSSGKKYPGRVDAAAGTFSISGLPLVKTYDCILDGANGRLEGINLKVPASDYEEEQPLVDEDIETIKEKVLSLNKFEEQIDILAIEGNIQHAAVLVNKLRTKAFYNSLPGEVVWRAELWHFERPEETWVKVQDELFIVLYRERLQHSAYKKKSILFDPALGGLTPTAEQSEISLKNIQLPDGEPGIRLRGKEAAAATAQAK